MIWTERLLSLSQTEGQRGDREREYSIMLVTIDYMFCNLSMSVIYKLSNLVSFHGEDFQSMFMTLNRDYFLSSKIYDPFLSVIMLIK